jgi:hypothetical protein
MTTEERLYKLEGIVEGVMAVLPERVSALERRMDLLRQEVKEEISGLRQEMAGLRQEVKAEIGNALNKAMLYFTALAAVLALITFLR